MSVACITLSAIQPGGPDPSDPANVVTRYLLEHPLLAAATFTHLDTAAIVYLTKARDIELLSVPVQSV